MRKSKQSGSILPCFPLVKFQQITHQADLDYGIQDYWAFPVMEGIYYLTKPSKLPLTPYQPELLVTPLSTCPHRECSGPILQQQALSIGCDTVWSVYHCTSNTWDSIRLWREIAPGWASAHRWQIRKQSAPVWRPVMEEMWPWLDQWWCQGQVGGHQSRGFTQLTVKGGIIEDGLSPESSLLRLLYWHLHLLYLVYMLRSFPFFFWHFQVPLLFSSK